ncbi:transglutaminase family protein [Ostreiculturibacter nitratireducens]|uniref:transglutaminase family protein n=1 Tax=Ostreiculturibacter nitratireducens TaxID=3075226 RepID=UPI0031B5FA77
MRLKITHTTRYDFDAPVAYGLQQLRKTPKSSRAQSVLSWTTSIEGGRKELQFEDQHRNVVELVSLDPGARSITVRCEGEVELAETHGVVGAHQGFAPLWLFQRSTDLTKAGPACRDLVRKVEGEGEINRLHNLSTLIGQAVSYEVGKSETHWDAEQVITAGHGVCQDHAHVFIACARLMGHPARYVSGYLMMDDRTEQEATHAWAEAHVDGLGWVGFDVSNGISPDTRYVRVATGLDYSEAAPVSGTRYGGEGEALTVVVEVAQQ